MEMLKSMAKPKKKAPQREQVVGEMDLDKIVASPAQMASLEKENKQIDKKKTEEYRKRAMAAMSIKK